METTELIKVEQVTELVSNAPEVLQKNQNLSERAVKNAQGLLDTIEAEGMSDEMDAALNEWQVTAKKAMEVLNGRRAPITQILDQIKKRFIEFEAPIDPKKADSSYAKIQNHRNAWAKKKGEEEKKRQEEVRRKQAAMQEQSEVRVNIQNVLKQAAISTEIQNKKRMAEVLDTATLETIGGVKEKLKGVKLAINRTNWDAISISLGPVYMTPDEALILEAEIKKDIYDEVNAQYRENIEAYRNELIDQIQSKKLELEEIEKAGAARKKQLEKEASERKLAEEKRMEEEEADRQRKADEDAASQKQLAYTNNLFDSAAEMNEGRVEQSGQVREGYEIKVLNPTGLGAIFLFWFDKEGQTLSVEAGLKKSIAQMKTFCEKWAMKENEKIAHKAIVYEDVFKAVAKKSA